MISIIRLSVFCWLVGFCRVQGASVVETDICIYGGTSGGIATAALAIEEKKPVQKVDYAELARRLTADKQILIWRSKGGDTQSDLSAR
jgi:hypothetical protein